MQKKLAIEESTNKKALKSGMWAAVCTFIQSAISFLTMPVFTRLLSPEDYGMVTTFNSWQSILGMICTVCLYASINKAVYDFKEDINGYASSMITLTVICVLIGYVIVSIFDKNGQTFLLKNLLFTTFISTAAINIFSNVQKFQFQYKLPALITLTTVLGNILLSLLLIYLNPEKKYVQRIIGGNAVSIVIGVIIILVFAVKGKKFINITYWKYGLKFGVPTVFHLVGMQVLNQSDRIMITGICGSYASGLYSVPYSICNIIIILWSSVTTGLSPWIFSKLNEGNYKEIHEIAKKIIKIVSFVVISFIAFAPIAMSVLADREYKEAVITMPAIAVGIFFTCIYNFYVILENYHRKPQYIAICTLLTAVINIVLNMIFIPEFGYIAAAYTTMFCYVILAIVHCWLSHMIDKNAVYPTKYMFSLGMGVMVIGLVLGAFYTNSLLRYLFYAVYVLFSLAANKKDLRLLIQMLHHKISRR